MRYRFTLLLLAVLLLLAGCRTAGPVPEAVSPSPESSSEAAVLTPVPPEPTPSPAVPSQTPQTETVPSCTLSISCGELLDWLEELPEETRALVPEDGVICPETRVEFAEGDSVFDVLQRVCRDAGIHLEFSVTPAYDSAYIEGIANLYEMDCGPLSGWSYTVNGLSPNYGCGQYTVAEGDVICWAYHCDLTAPGVE